MICLNIANLYFTFLFFFCLVTSCKKKECKTQDFIGTTSGTWMDEDSFTCPPNLLDNFSIVQNPNSDFGVLFMHNEKDSIIFKVDLTGPNENGCTIESSNFPEYVIDGFLSNGNLQMSYQDKDGNITCMYNGTISN